VLRSSVFLSSLLILSVSGCAARMEQPANTGGASEQTNVGATLDTKGVEFGPWMRGFIATLKRQWTIPYAEMANRGRVVVTFRIAKDGTIHSPAISQACGVEAFNRAALNAVASLKRAAPLPREYRADHADFTVTFYYNDNPGD